MNTFSLWIFQHVNLKCGIKNTQIINAPSLNPLPLKSLDILSSIILTHIIIHNNTQGLYILQSISVPHIYIIINKNISLVIYNPKLHKFMHKFATNNYSSHLYISCISCSYSFLFRYIVIVGSKEEISNQPWMVPRWYFSPS